MNQFSKYLKSRQHYLDRYDRHTVEYCRSLLARPMDKKALREDLKKKNLDEKEGIRIMTAANRLCLYFYTGERYINKEETIHKWMKEDEARDKLFETAEAPKDITCFTCGRLMFVSSKQLNMGIEKGTDTVLFFYDCPLNHIPHRAFYNTGEEFRRDPPLCPKCKSQVHEKARITAAAFITKVTCPSCDYTNTDKLKRTKSPEVKPDPNFEKDRSRFCLSDKEGQKYIQEKASLEQLSKLMDKWKEREKNKELYDKVAKLKKLKIVGLEELFAPILEKSRYIKLQFKNPEITKDVIVPFTVYEKRPDREERASTYDLEKLLRKTLKDTNWRLMTGGVSYRLGMLEGRLRGYEREEDLLKLVK